MWLSTAAGLVLFLYGFGAESSGQRTAMSGSDPAPAWTAVDAQNCGSSGASCQVLGQSLENPRSISRIRADGTFFVGTSGNAQSDLINELITNQDSDSSTIYRYTEAGGLAPWVTQKPSQFILAFDVSSRSYVPIQVGINGVEPQGGDLYYTILYNKGPASYEQRSRSDTADTGISFGELRRIVGGVTNPNGQDEKLADLGQAEINHHNPDGVVYPVADGFGHQPGDPVYAMNPYGLLLRDDKIFVADAAGNDLFRYNKDTSNLSLIANFPIRLQTQEPVPVKVFQGPDNLLYVTLFRCVNEVTAGAFGGVAEVNPATGDFHMVSFNRLPISGTIGPDGFLYVLEFSNQDAPKSGRVLRTRPQNYDDFNGRPVSDGEVVVNHLDYPVDMAFDPQGRLVIVESGTLDAFTVDGRVIRVTLQP
jgi:hypothetical protein